MGGRVAWENVIRVTVAKFIRREDGMGHGCLTTFVRTPPNFTRNTPTHQEVFFFSHLYRKRFHNIRSESKMKMSAVLKNYPFLRQQ